MRGQSEPPQHLQIPVNPRTGLRKGFPIKIAGHAIGGRGEPVQSEGNLFSQRLRTRRNSASCFERSVRERSVDVKIRPDNQTVPLSLNSQQPLSVGDTNGFRRRSIGGLPSSRLASSLVDRQSDRDPNQKISSQSDQQDVGQIPKEENTFPKIDRQQNIPKIPPNIFEANSVNNNVLNNDIEADVVNNKDDMMILNNFCDRKEILNGKTQTFDIDVAIAKMSEELKAFEGLSKDSKDLCDNNFEKKIIEDNSLDDVITKMKNSLKAIKDGMSVNALVDLNREFTPLDLPPLREVTPADLPALSPIPQFSLQRAGDGRYPGCETQFLVLPRPRPGPVVSRGLQDGPDDVLCEGQGQFSNTEVESSPRTSQSSVTEESQTEKTGTILPQITTLRLKSPLITLTDPSLTCDEGETPTQSSDSDDSTSSTPTMTECQTGYESDTTLYPDTDCEDIYGGPGVLKTGQLSELSDLESEHEDVRTIDQNYYDVITERLTTIDVEKMFSRKLERQPGPRRHSLGGEKTNNKNLRYCWKCHKSGHESYQCQDENFYQTSSCCPRCLEPNHWEDNCWVASSPELCSVCSVPGHLSVVHTTTDFNQRKLIIDTFGWLSFKDWFQDLQFRRWWNCSGFTGVPLYKIMMRNNSHDVSLQ